MLVRDLPVAGCVDVAVVARRRFYCDACGRTFAGRIRRCRRGSGSALASVSIYSGAVAAAQRTRRSRAKSERCAARSIAPSRSVARSCSLDASRHRHDVRPWMARTVAAVRARDRRLSELDRKWVLEVLDGRSRQVVERCLRSVPGPERRAIPVVSIDPYEAYRDDPQRAAVGPDRGRPLPPRPWPPTPHSTASGATANANGHRGNGDRSARRTRPGRCGRRASTLDRGADVGITALGEVFDGM